MEKNKKEALLKTLFENWSNEKVYNIYALPPSGSYREYYRISGKTRSAIGAYNPDKKENTAFLTFSKHFYDKGLPVPEIYAEATAQNMYLQEDLGDTTLFAYLTKIRNNGDFPAELLEIYKRVIDEMPRFQIEAAKDLNYDVCYPRDSFDKQSMMWDANYFKYYFLKLAKIPFDEQLLEDDFQRFTDFLLQADRHFFLYRDFQSRNVMIQNEKPYFIDYQGGRKGALHYDLASLLYDGKADIPNDIRVQLRDYYIDTINQYLPVNREEFIHYFYGYVIIRIMQAMGAYGFRGFYEKKEHFLLSIPYALNNLEWLLKHIELPVKIPMLLQVLNEITQSDFLRKIGRPKDTLTVTIHSFSYKKGIPEDKSGNGGGFVFDCRAIHNPGRYEKYKQLTGKDKEVIEFFEKESDIERFLNLTYTLVDSSIENYRKRYFSDLLVAYGCTGGQHRSVYSAERLAQHVRKKYNVNVELHHQELDKLSS